MASKYEIRSISLPPRSHPTTLSLEEKLNKLKTWEASSTSSSESICIGLSGLEDLCVGVNHLLNMSSTQEVISHYPNEKCLDNLLDGSVRILDICGIARDVMLQFKEQVQALQSALRRRKGNSSIESSIASYSCFTNKMKKEAKKSIAVLKQMDCKLKSSPVQDHHLIQLIKEVVAINSSVFQSLFLFLSTSKPKQSRWSMVSKLMHKGAQACEEKQETVNQLESVDAALSERPHFEKMQIAQRRLEALEISIQDIENFLESVFKHLIKTRATILNIISQ
ncbi:uncharacterized protein LOC110604753 [Manihot esculenta]|uniref:DUF241 domain-containing protein n=1 Tax=Manihot esculenta TaxID=3983 RepID=A0A2C9WFI7_MANES|nr:uncharacterized protein LOC110604753 [Manihot esculenta]OAY57631.1 hypothetical protein MANES_02G112000v8 [Manihot esculenta]